MINVTRKITDSDDGYSKFARSVNAVLAGIRESGSYANRDAEAKRNGGSVKCTELTEIVAKNTNLNVTVFIDYQTKLNAYTTVPLVTAQTVMLDDWVRKYAQEYIEAQTKKDLRKRKQLEGWVDSDGKVQGYYKEVPIEIHLGYSFVYKDQGGDMEITNAGAVLFHEIGHDITLFKSLTQTCRTNAILFDSHQELLGINNADEKVIFLQKVADKNDLNIDSTALKNAKQSEVYTILIGAVQEKFYSEYGCNVYEYRNFEAMADNYAVRHGYPVSLVTGLDKMYTPAPASSVGIRTRNCLFGLLEFIAELVGTGLFWLSFLWLIVNPTYKIYDEPKMRFIRIRNEMLSSLRNRKVSSARRQKLVHDIELVDKVIAKYSVNRSLLEVTYEFLTCEGRRGKNLRRLHQVYEALNANTLYASTVKIESMLD